MNNAWSASSNGGGFLLVCCLHLYGVQGERPAGPALHDLLSAPAIKLLTEYTEMFSASCHYALLAMFYIGRNSREGRNVELADIAARQDIPKHFLSKILQQLVRHKLLVSTKGPHGGFRLSKPCQDIKLIEVVRAIDGEDIFRRCGIGLRSCNACEPCPIHEEYHQTRRNVHQLFKSKSLKILADEAINGRSFIKYEPAGSE